MGKFAEFKREVWPEVRERFHHAAICLLPPRAPSTILCKALSGLERNTRKGEDPPTPYEAIRRHASIDELADRAFAYFEEARRSTYAFEGEGSRSESVFQQFGIAIELARREEERL